MNTKMQSVSSNVCIDLSALVHHGSLIPRILWRIHNCTALNINRVKIVTKWAEKEIQPSSCS
jgi:hypothetical protein